MKVIDKVREYYNVAVNWIGDHPQSAFWVLVGLAALNLVR